MQEDEDTPRTPGWLGDGILENGIDQGAARRAAIREANTRRQQAEAHRDAQKGQDRAERPQRVTVPGKPAPPLGGRRARPVPVPMPEAKRPPLHPAGLARLLTAIERGPS